MGKFLLLVLLALAVSVVLAPVVTLVITFGIFVFNLGRKTAKRRAWTGRSGPRARNPSAGLAPLDLPPSDFLSFLRGAGPSR
jgi:hypothetical protein